MTELSHLYHVGLGMVSFQILKERLRVTHTPANTLQGCIPLTWAAHCCLLYQLYFCFSVPCMLCSKTTVKRMVTATYKTWSKAALMTLPNGNPQTPKQKKHTGRLLTNMAQDRFWVPKGKRRKTKPKRQETAHKFRLELWSQMFNQRLARIRRWGCSEW